MPPAKRAASPPAERLPRSADRWVVRRKAALVEAVRGGTMTLDEACRKYQLSPEEFTSWVSALETHGVPGLRATRFQIYRSHPRSSARTLRSMNEK
jgi:hypothetical protein